MSDYTKTVDFDAKDDLPSGNAGKVVKGSELDTEFNNIATAVATKFDSDDRGAANGIASLDSNTLVPAAELPAATTSAQGAVELSTNAEAVAGSDTDRAVTPSALEARFEQGAGVVNDLNHLTDPGADRILFWDDSATDTTFLAVSTGLSISGTDLSTDDSAIVHDNLSGFVANEHVDHTAVTLTAGVGLTGGGDISNNRTFDLDISGLTNIDISDTAATDSVLINDGGTMKQVDVQDMGVRVVGLSTIQTFALGDSNTLQLLTGTTDRTWTIPLNSSVAFHVGAVIYLGSRDTAVLTITATSGVTLTSRLGSGDAGSDDVVAGGMAVLIKVDTDEWMLSGDIA